MLLIGAALPVLAMLLMSGMLALQIRQRTLDVAWTEHSDEVLKTADECLLYLTQMATIVRDYVIRGDPNSLASYHRASDQAAGSLSALALLVRDNPAQLDRVDAIGQLQGDVAGRYDEIIQDHDLNGCSDCKADLTRSRQVMSRMYQKFGQLIDFERNLRLRRQSQQTHSERR